MDLRIDHIRHGEQTVIYIAGHLCGPAVAQFMKTCETVEGPLVIDLSSLLFADGDGIKAIMGIKGRGAHLHGASPFVELLLKDTENGKRSGADQSRFIWS